MPSEVQIAFFLQQLVNAAPVAALYATLAFGYALSFGLVRRAEFTPGALFAFAGQVFVFFTAVGWKHSISYILQRLPSAPPPHFSMRSRPSGSLRVM